MKHQNIVNNHAYILVFSGDCFFHCIFIYIFHHSAIVWHKWFMANENRINNVATDSPSTDGPRDWTKWEKDKRTIGGGRMYGSRIEGIHLPPDVPIEDEFEK